MNLSENESFSNNWSDNNLLRSMIPSFNSEQMSSFHGNTAFQHLSRDFKHSFSLSQIAIPPKIRNSTIYTVLSPDTSREIVKKSRSKSKQIAIIDEGEQSSSISLAQNKEYCYVCEDLRSTALRVQNKAVGFWPSLLSFFQTIKCCTDPGVFINSQEIISYCLKCGSDLSKVPVNTNN